MKSDLATFSRTSLEVAMAAYGPPDRQGECLLWTGPRRPAGYGLTRADGITLSAHRIACFLAHGAPNGRKDACHSCDQPACIEPKHLFWGTRSENMLDASSKRRLWQHQRPNDVAHGLQHSRAKLTEEQLREIIFTSTSHSALARKFNYDRTNIGLIRAGRLYKRETERIRALTGGPRD